MQKFRFRNVDFACNDRVKMPPMKAKAKTEVKFLSRDKEDFDFVDDSLKGEHCALCKTCHCGISISHGGRKDIALHASSAKHKGNTTLDSLDDLYLYVCAERCLELIVKKIQFLSGDPRYLERGQAPLRHPPPPSQQELKQPEVGSYATGERPF